MSSKDVPCPGGWHSTCRWQGWKLFDPPSCGKGSVVPVLGKMCPRQPGDGSVPVVPSGGSLQICMALGSRAPQHSTRQPRGSSAARGCVGRCKEDVCELPQGCAPRQHPGCWGGDARVWVPSRVPRG